jgi:branched-chain amino acid transport system substrate-binding protein
MNKGIKIIMGIVIIAILVNLVFLTNFNGNTVKGEKETIRIGVVLPLTGGISFLGQAGQKSILLAKSQLGETKFNYELIFEDDKLDPKLTSTVTQKLININNVDAMISASSGSGNVVAPVTQSKKIVHIGVASDANIAKGEYNFIHWTTPDEEARMFVEEVQRRNIKTISSISVNQQGTDAIIESVQKHLKGTGTKIAYEGKFNFGETDFKTILLKAKGKNPDAYLIHAFSPELEILAKQAKELGIPELIAIEAFEFTEQPELFEGMWYIQAASSSEDFAKAFEAKYNSQPAMASANLYDAFNLIVKSYETAAKDGEKPSNQEVAKALSNVRSFNGALGKLKVLDEGIVYSKASVKQVKNGKFITLR